MQRKQGVLVLQLSNVMVLGEKTAGHVIFDICHKCAIINEKEL